jgi:hypothetical protein
MVKPYHARQKQNKKTSGIMPLAKTNPGEIYCVSPPLCPVAANFSTEFFENHDFISISANSSWK